MWRTRSMGLIRIIFLNLRLAHWLGTYLIPEEDARLLPCYGLVVCISSCAEINRADMGVQKGSVTSPKCLAEEDTAPHLWHWGEEPGRGVRPGFRRLTGDLTMSRPV